MNNQESKCPFHGANSQTKNDVQDWWPKTLNLDILHQHDKKTSLASASVPLVTAILRQKKEIE